MPPWIERVVQRVAPLANWEDLSLPGDSQEAMRRIVTDMKERAADARGRNGSKAKGRARTGVATIFNGTPGPQKITAAEVLAKELEMNLYRVDMSMVIGSHLKETERILGRIIDGAEEAGGVLFFDEADALFGKDGTTDVDKGIGYLVKRAIRYEDLAIISVTDKSQMDLVHLRKLRPVVEFGG